MASACAPGSPAARPPCPWCSPRSSPRASASPPSPSPAPRWTTSTCATRVVLPLSFLSSALLQQNLAPSWLQHVARYNPVNWAVEAGRVALGGSVDWGFVGVRVGGLLALTIVCAWLGTRAFRAYQRSV